MKKSHVDVSGLPSSRRMISKQGWPIRPCPSGAPQAGVFDERTCGRCLECGCGRRSDFPGKLTVCPNFPHQKPKPFLSQQSRPCRARSPGLWREKMVHRQNLVQVLQPDEDGDPRRWAATARPGHALLAPGCLGQAAAAT